MPRSELHVAAAEPLAPLAKVASSLRGDWTPVLLGDLVDVVHGFAFAGEHFVDDPCPDVLVTPGNFAVGGGFKLGKPKYYRGPVPSNYILEAGQLIVTMTDLSKTGDTLGYGAIVPKVAGIRFLHNQRIGRVVQKRPDLALPSFLHWVLRTAEYRNGVLGSASGSTVKHTAPSRIATFRFSLPPIEQQRAIAAVLDALDDKIELNRRTNETLEAMARALFKSWFVDFDPVHAKAEGRTPTGMDAETAALFPSELVASALGPIPRGWGQRTLRDCVMLKRGTTYKGMLVGKPGPALLGLGSIVPGGGFRSSYKTYGGDCPPELMLGPGDLYVSLKGATKDGEMIGSIARLPRTVPSGRLTQDTVKLDVADARLPRFLYRLLLTPEYRTYCANRAMGSAVVALSRDDFLSYPVALPPDPVLDRIDAIFAALDSRAEHADAESVTLAAIRDALLPRLLSGELSVGAGEAAA